MDNNKEKRNLALNSIRAIAIDHLLAHIFCTLRIVCMHKYYFYDL